jgi:hypothetical protein
MRAISLLPAAFGAFLFLFAAAPAAGQGQICRTTADCPANRTCLPSGRISTCQYAGRNNNRDCSAARPFCDVGICKTGCRANAQCAFGQRCVINVGETVGLCRAVLPGADVTNSAEGRACGWTWFPPRNLGSCPSGYACLANRCRSP